MIPHEKQMVARLRQKRFVLIGINSDGDRSVLQRIMRDQGITWHSAVEGSTHGSIATRWNVHGWPTTYVLDAKGVIRYRDVRDAEMEKAVDTLLKERGD